MRLVTLGMWVWGTVTAVLAGVTLYVIASGQPHELFERIKDSSTVLGAILAASALAWSHFFQSTDRQDIDRKLTEIGTRLSAVLAKLP